MNIIETIPLFASVLATVAPAMQVVHITRTKSVTGLSVLTCVALVISNCLAILMGVQYNFGATLVIMTVSLLIQAYMLHLVSLKASLVTWSTIILSIVALMFFAPDFGAQIITLQYSEPVAFVWGIIAATTFIPQVLITRKTKQTGDISMITIVCFALAFTLWTIFALIVQNWSLLLWFVILTLSVYELLRLKLTIKPDGKI